MHRIRTLGFLMVLVGLVGCGGRTVSMPDGSDTSSDHVTTGDVASDALPRDGGDVSPTDVITQDTPPPIDVVAMDTPPPPDVVAMDTPPPIDVVVMDTPPPPDVVVMDTPPPPDVVVMDTPPPPDVPTAMCPTSGIGDTCAEASACMVDLGDGMLHTASFAGAARDYMPTCAPTGAMSDVVYKLTLTMASDVTIRGTPTGGDRISVSVDGDIGCAMSSELQCNQSGTAATVTLHALAAGTYYVIVQTSGTNPATVQATITPPMTRLPGDVCPGIDVATDGTPATIVTNMFSTTADYGTTCGSGTAPANWVDFVYHFHLTAASDVHVHLSGSNAMSLIRQMLETTCGNRGTAVMGVGTNCATGEPSDITFRNLPAGDYYVIAEVRSTFSPETIIATVTATAPTPPDPADMCSGVALTAATPTTTAVAGLNVNYALACLNAGGITQAADGVYSFAGPDAMHDVIVGVTSDVMTANVGVQLESTCGTATSGVGICIGPTEQMQTRTAHEAFNRYHALTTGTTYYAISATDQTTGHLTTEYWTVPAVTPVSTTGGNGCMAAIAIPSTGGVFTGDTTTFANNVNIPTQCRTVGTVTLACGGGQDAIYSITLTAMSRLIISTAESSFDTYVALIPGTTCPTGTPGATNIVCNDDTYGLQSFLDQTVPAGTYYIVVDGCGAAARGAYHLDVAVLPP